MFDCADFVNQGWSNGIFDLFENGRMVLTIEIVNDGQSPATNVRLKSETDGRFLTVLDVTSSSGRAEFDSTSADVLVERLDAGQTVSVPITLKARSYSIPTGEPVPVRSWIESMDEGYQKDGWADPPTDMIGQNFNGGDLRALFEADVYSPRRWTWSSDDDEMVEGWTAPVALRNEMMMPSGLFIPPQSTPVFIDSPFLPVDSDDIREIFVRTVPNQVFRFWWRRLGEPFDADRTLILSSEATAVNPGLIPRDIAQVRMELSGGTIVGELHLRAETGRPISPRDAFLEVPADASIGDARSSRVTDGPAVNPDQDMSPDVNDRPRTSSTGTTIGVSHTGGCVVAEWSPVAPFLGACVLLLYRRLRRKWHAS